MADLLRCENRVGARTCRQSLVVWTDAIGAVHTRCARCEARAAGRCWQCGKPRTNHPRFGIYCERCSKAAQRIAQRRYETSVKGKAVKAQYDAARWRDPVRGAKKRASKKAWEAANPEKLALYKKRDWMSHLSKRERMERAMRTPKET
jgi:hypothetical protein